MASGIRVTYLLNSGFLVRGEGWALVFDYFQDPAGAVERAAAECADMWFLVSHGHADHWSPSCVARHRARRYVVSSDVRRLGPLPPERVALMAPHSHWEDGPLRVDSLGSTDEGTSYAVRVAGWSLYHAGDYNWWHWAGDTEENNAVARRGFESELARMRGLDFDVAFFPVDGRLGEAESWGAREFCSHVNVRALVAMHRLGYGPFRPGEGFFPAGRSVPCWSPVTPGETLNFNKE